MLLHPIARRLGLFATLVCLATNLACEGIDRRHDSRVADISLPPEDPGNEPEPEDLPNLPDVVETVHEARESYLNELVSLERSFLMYGDTVRANWARRQRELATRNQYPYLEDGAPEERVTVAPEAQIPEADELYRKGVELYESFEGVPGIGFSYLNHEKPRDALALFRKVLTDYPKSDKVDDSAYYCGEIYKEFLREDDPDNELAIRYLRWAFTLDPVTPHPARFSCAVIYDFRLHDRDRAIELYHQVLELDEATNNSNQRFAATRIEQLSDDRGSHIRPRDTYANTEPGRPVMANVPEEEP